MPPAKRIDREAGKRREMPKPEPLQNKARRRAKYFDGLLVDCQAEDDQPAHRSTKLWAPFKLQARERDAAGGKYGVGDVGGVPENWYPAEGKQIKFPIKVFFSFRRGAYICIFLHICQPFLCHPNFYALRRQ